MIRVHTNVRVLLLFVLVTVAPLSAGVALLVGEPFGKFGSLNPTGHAAIYLSGVCAESPTSLRLCRSGEAGVVISRYNRIGGYDWIAVPLVAYLYAVERPENVPTSADAQGVALLRDAYRRAHLRELAADGPNGEAPKGGWTQLVGAAYDRTIYGFELETTVEDDERLILHLISQDNRRRFHLLFRNCADFARSVVNFYYPRALRRNVIADIGISTPKQSAKALVRYGRLRPELRLSYFVIPQVPGVPRSKKVRGVSESLIRSKKYAVPLLVLQPWVAATAAAAYVAQGRFDPARQCQKVCEPGSLDSRMAGADSGAHNVQELKPPSAQAAKGSHAVQISFRRSGPLQRSTAIE